MFRRSMFALLALCAAPAFAVTTQTQTIVAHDAQGKVLQETTVSQALAPDGTAETYRLTVVKDGHILQKGTLVVPNGGQAHFDLTRSYPYRKTVTQTEPNQGPAAAPITDTDVVTDGLKVTLTGIHARIRVAIEQSTLEAIQSFTSGEATIDLPQRSIASLLQTVQLRTGESFSYPMYRHRAPSDASGNPFFVKPQSAEADLPLDRTITLTHVGPADPVPTAMAEPSLYHVTLEKQRPGSVQRLSETTVAVQAGETTPLAFISEMTYLPSSSTVPTAEGGTVTTLTPATVQTGLALTLKVAKVQDDRTQLVYTFRGDALRSMATVTPRQGNPFQRPSVTTPFKGEGSADLAVGDSQRVALSDTVTATIKRVY